MSLQENIEFFVDKSGSATGTVEVRGLYTVDQDFHLTEEMFNRDEGRKELKAHITESIRQRLVSDAMDVGFLDYIVTEEEYRELLMEATDKLLWEEKMRVGPNAPRRVQERIKKLTWLMDAVAKLKVTSPYEASLKFEEIWGRAKENPEVVDIDKLIKTIYEIEERVWLKVAVDHQVKSTIGSCDTCKYMMCNDGGVCCSVISFPDGMPDDFYCGFYSKGECIK